ncbi:hypothetical protein O1611_g3046 [Lasiodiplodia mahajangana]|uniref:Uncharacterized protein n=1 Tax=Lasiodiplodia mahajangana TaxID=1108764 RepID=A0ACC2JTB2_9PEZI|nr:hypothetical protein O1611_g3046 [Lasiodiplodia mahajangana]
MLNTTLRAETGYDDRRTTWGTTISRLGMSPHRPLSTDGELPDSNQLILVTRVSRGQDFRNTQLVTAIEFVIADLENSTLQGKGLAGVMDAMSTAMQNRSVASITSHQPERQNSARSCDEPRSMRRSSYREPNEEEFHPEQSLDNEANAPYKASKTFIQTTVDDTTKRKSDSLTGRPRATKRGRPTPYPRFQPLIQPLLGEEVLEGFINLVAAIKEEDKQYSCFQVSAQDNLERASRFSEISTHFERKTVTSVRKSRSRASAILDVR